MDILGGLVDMVRTIPGAFVDVAKESWIPLIAGGVLKHGLPIIGKKATSWLPNDLIPLVNLALFGPVGAAGATLTHQIAKIGTRAIQEKLVGTSAKLAKGVGPGRRLSI
jgi:hypothetical protein